MLPQVEREWIVDDARVSRAGKGDVKGMDRGSAR